MRLIANEKWVSVTTGIMIVVAVLMLPLMTLADDARFKAPDTVFADLSKIDNQTWSVTISCFNDEDVVGVAVPLKMDAGMTKIRADSAVYRGGRVEKWSYLGFRPDTAIQCVTLGMVASAGPNDVYMPAGKGRLVTVFVSSTDGKPIEDLTVDTTTTAPSNTLVLIARRDNSIPTDSLTAADFNKRLMTPIWVVRKQAPMKE